MSEYLHSLVLVRLNMRCELGSISACGPARHGGRVSVVPALRERRVVSHSRRSDERAGLLQRQLKPPPCVRMSIFEWGMKQGTFLSIIPLSLIIGLVLAVRTGASP